MFYRRQGINWDINAVEYTINTIIYTGAPWRLGATPFAAIGRLARLISEKKICTARRLMTSSRR